MHRLWLAAIISPLFCTTACALSFWDGSITVRALTGSGCADTGLSIGDFLTATYRVRFPANDPAQQNTAILIRTARGVQFVINGNSNPSGQMQGIGAYTGSTINDRAFSRTGNGNYSLTVNPSLVRQSTTIVTIAGTLDNVFPNDVGPCSMTFTGMFERRPK